MDVNVVLVDLNPKIITAWKKHFDGEATVKVVKGSILEQPVSAWVTPTNAKGDMSGGVDAAVKKRFGAVIERRVKRAIADEHKGDLPVGYATCVRTGRRLPSWLISTPTAASAGAIRDTMNVALACCAAFEAIALHNELHIALIRSVAIPGLGAGTGRVPPESCAELMWTAFNLFRRRTFEDFAAMHEAFEVEVRGIDPASSSVEAARALRQAMFARAGLKTD